MSQYSKRETYGPRKGNEGERLKKENKRTDVSI